MDNQSDKAARWRAKAEECRLIAQSMTDPTARAAFVQMAEVYERRAGQQEPMRPAKAVKGNRSL